MAASSCKIKLALASALLHQDGLDPSETLAQPLGGRSLDSVRKELEMEKEDMGRMVCPSFFNVFWRVMVNKLRGHFLQFMRSCPNWVLLSGLRGSTVAA